MSKIPERTDYYLKRIVFEDDSKGIVIIQECDSTGVSTLTVRIKKCLIPDLIEFKLSNQDGDIYGTNYLERVEALITLLQKTLDNPCILDNVIF